MIYRGSLLLLEVGYRAFETAKTFGKVSYIVRRGEGNAQKVVLPSLAYCESVRMQRSNASRTEKVLGFWTR